MSVRIVRDLGSLYLERIATLDEKIAGLGTVLRREAARGPATFRLQTMRGARPITGVAIETFARPMETFRRGRDFAARLGLVPIQRSTGGRQRLGRMSKTGRRDIRRLLITGVMAVIRWASRKGALQSSWLARKPRRLVAMALANKMARAAWAMPTKQETFRDPAEAAT